MLASSLLSFAAVALVVVAAPTPNSPSVTTPQGTWIGERSRRVESFRGIPFAEPPVGNLRFAPPVASTKNYGIYDATDFGYACPQVNALAGAVPGALGRLVEGGYELISSLPFISASLGGNQSEDCLTINVQRPATIKAGVKLPVMFWIYGGAFNMGSSGSFDGTPLVTRSVDRDQPIIFVSANHRINSFGFLPGKEVAADPTASVNAGLFDQRLALEWVQKNIEAFGGDPAKVTIFGESSGAISIGFHLLGNGGDPRGLFRAAIMQSGAPIPVDVTARGQPSFDTIAKATGCYGSATPIACLRAVPFKKLVDATDNIGSILSYRSVALAFLPRVDGQFISGNPLDLVAAGQYAKVPILTGNQWDEGTLLTLGTLNITTTAELRTWLSTLWFPNASATQLDRILDEYPQDVTRGSPFDTGFFNVITPQNKRISALIGDIVFQAPRRAFLNSAALTQPVWAYASQAFRGLPVLGTFHGSDVFAVSGQLPVDPAEEMQSRWISFANNLSPAIPDGIDWPRFTPGGPLLQFVGAGGRSSIIADTYRRSAMAYLVSIQNVLTF